ncbi:MAG: hypothetical protein ACTSX4_00705 [Candidatus Helarchaeota archaeon]
MPKSKKRKKTKKKSTKKFETLDDLLISDFATIDKLFYLVDLSNLSYQIDESKENLAMKLLYESTMGLDEIIDILWNNFELQNICKELDLDITNKSKNHLIGMLIKSLPCKKKRKIRTIIEEAVEEGAERLRIFNIFIMYPDGRSLFSFNLEAIPIGDSSMITSALNAITHLIKEITKGISLDSIDVTDKILLFDYGKVNLAPNSQDKIIGWNLIGVLLVSKESKEAKRLLKEFLNKFEDKYVRFLLPRFDGCLDYFKDATELVKEVFKDYM